MSDGMNDARRESEAIGRVELAALKLGQSIRATRDAMYFPKGNTAAIRAANEILTEFGLVLDWKE